MVQYATFVVTLPAALTIMTAEVKELVAMMFFTNKMAARNSCNPKVPILKRDGRASPTQRGMVMTKPRRQAFREPKYPW